MKEVVSMERPIVTLTTDFGLSDHFVGTMKGVILNIAPHAEIVDLCHSVEPFDILDGALTIAEAYHYFPERTVHVVVVDPGVGSARRPILAASDRYNFVAPDNGVLSLIYAREGRLDVRHVNSNQCFLEPISNTFHGRDIFAPVAAYLAKGVDREKLGPQIADYVRFEAPKPKPVDAQTLRGVVLKVDRFGNLITNFTPQDIPALFERRTGFKISVGQREVTALRTSYSDGAAGEVFAILGSMGYLEISANRGAANQLTGAAKGTEVHVSLEDALAAGS
jgi:S-adenosylmethionine hydrolase